MMPTAMPSAPEKLTYRDFVRFPDDGQRHELIDGAHHVTPSPATLHQRVVGNLYFLIRSHVERHGGGEVFLSPFDVVFSFFDVVVPDLIVVTDAHRGGLTEKHFRGAPDLIVEVSSPRTRGRDAGAKLALYERAGVAEYWVVDPSARAVRVFRRHGTSLTRLTTLRAAAADDLDTPILPGLAMPLNRVFSR